MSISDEDKEWPGSGFYVVSVVSFVFRLQATWRTFWTRVTRLWFEHSNRLLNGLFMVWQVLAESEPKRLGKSAKFSQRQFPGFWIAFLDESRHCTQDLRMQLGTALWSLCRESCANHFLGNFVDPMWICEMQAPVYPPTCQEKMYLVVSRGH